MRLDSLVLVDHFSKIVRKVLLKASERTLADAWYCDESTAISLQPMQGCVAERLSIIRYNSLWNAELVFDQDPDEFR